MLVRRMGESQPMVRLRDEMDKLLERFFGEEPFRGWEMFGLRRFPGVNIWQDDDNLFVEAELPGLTERDIDLTVAGNELTIKGRRAEVEPTTDVMVHRHERGGGEFGRVIHLPLDVDEHQVEADFRNGVLTITLPKADVARARHIPVKATTG